MRNSDKNVENQVKPLTENRFKRRFLRFTKDKKMFLTIFFFGSVGRTERSALQALRRQLFVHKSDLISAFQELDPNNSG